MVSSVIPAKAGIQKKQALLDPGACPGPDPGFAGVTTLKAFCETVFIGQSENFSAFRSSNALKQVNKSRKGRSIKR
jgi:hypothetical protein